LLFGVLARICWSPAAPNSARIRDRLEWDYLGLQRADEGSEMFSNETNSACRKRWGRGDRLGCEYL